MNPVIGVSPAYFVSSYGSRFTPAEVAQGLARLAALGFHGFQLEVVHRESLDAWGRGGADLVRRRSAELGLAATQFVAHFMLHAFADPASLFSDAGIAEMPAVLEIAGRFEECRLVTVPLPAFAGPRLASAEDCRRLSERCVEKLGRMLAMVESAGRRMALEILPGALVGGIDGFMRLCERMAADSLGLNFDTGHAWACKENLYMVPAKLGPRILGTHLCDNFGNENLSLRPGAGSIDWPRLVACLEAAGYQGSWDIEIACPPEEADRQYGSGRQFIATLVT
jgi:sugar phosphate isomerase/epimerase